MEHKEETNTYSWDIPPENEQNHADFIHSLNDLLDPYEPVFTERESDIQWTTNEIIQSIEMHYGMPQGDAEKIGIDGKKLVDELTRLGFKASNTGGLQLQWLMRKKHH